MNGCIYPKTNAVVHGGISYNWIKRYAVGHFIPKAGDVERLEYSDPIQACAAFIKHEIEDIRSGVESRVTGMIPQPAEF